MGKVRRDCDGEGEELPPPHQMAPGEERFLREIRLFFSLKTQIFCFTLLEPPAGTGFVVLGQGSWCCSPLGVPQLFLGLHTHH